MPGLLPGIRVLPVRNYQRRGWPGQARPWRSIELLDPREV